MAEFMESKGYLSDLFNVAVSESSVLASSNDATLYYVALPELGVAVAKIYKDACFSNHVNTEVSSLKHLKKICLETGGPYVPEVYVGTSCGLLMEYIDPMVNPTSQDFSFAGELLANLHLKRGEYYGFETDNFLGPSAQINTLSYDWGEFYYNNRLAFQCYYLKRAEITDRIEALKTKCLNLLNDNEVYPSFLHGDLWSGNLLFDKKRGPTLIDPACYYGDYEADMAMTHLFSGLEKTFYQGHKSKIGVRKNDQKRLPIYKLYHLLNHLNIFGDSYLNQTLNCITEIEQL